MRFPLGIWVKGYSNLTGQKLVFLTSRRGGVVTAHKAGMFLTLPTGPGIPEMS